jgi:cytidylate kinase
MPHHAIAIDGPAASGKSTVALRLAEQLGLIMVNSGAMYRAITWKTLSENISPQDADAVRALLERIDIHCGDNGITSSIAIDGHELHDELRSEDVNRNVSTISAIPAVRDRLIGLQRAYLTRTSVVMEGRDIGSVVFPDTPFKIYIDAAEHIRAARRGNDGEVDTIAKRDAADASRATAPLVIAPGATVLDSTELTIDEVVQASLDILRTQGFPMHDC